MAHFKQRDLQAFSVEPLLLFPTHYTGEQGYFSDTETSTIWDDVAVATDWDRQNAQRSSKQDGQGHPMPPGTKNGDVPSPSAVSHGDEL